MYVVMTLFASSGSNCAGSANDCEDFLLDAIEEEWGARKVTNGQGSSGYRAKKADPASPQKFSLHIIVEEWSNRRASMP